MTQLILLAIVTDCCNNQEFMRKSQKRILIYCLEKREQSISTKDIVIHVYRRHSNIQASLLLRVAIYKHLLSTEDSNTQASLLPVLNNSIIQALLLST